MRRIAFVVCAMFGASLLALLVALSAQAQAADQYEDGGSGGGSGDVAEVPPPPENVDEYSAEGVEDRTVNSVAADPYSQVVDDATRGRFSAPGWQKVSDPEAYGGGAFRADAGRRSDAVFRVKVPETGYYTLYALWPAKDSNTAAARVGVTTGDGVRWEEVNQRVDGSEWVRVGAYKLERGSNRPVLVSPGGGGATMADAVMISENVLIGKNAEMVSLGDPDQLSGEETAAPTASRSLTERGGGGKTKRRAIVRKARNHLGNPYDYSHRRCKRGMAREDCSCLTRNVFLSFGKKLPDSPVYQWKYGKRVSKSNMRRGDLVFHDLNRDGDLKDHYADHVSIWSGNGNIIHASSYFGKVVESKERYLNRYHGTKRLRFR